MASCAAAGWNRFAGTGQPQWAGGRGGSFALRAALCHWPLRRRCCRCRRAPSSRPAGSAIGPWRPDRGITGHLDEYHPVFRDGWKGTPSPRRRPTPTARAGRWNSAAYWLDGLLRLGFVLHDDALIQKATARLGLVVDGVNRGGTVVHLLEEGQAAGLQQLGPFADGPGPGGLVSGHRPAADPRRPGQGLRRLSRAHGHASTSTTT